MLSFSGRGGNQQKTEERVGQKKGGIWRTRRRERARIVLERAKGSREKLKTPEWGGASSVINGAGGGHRGQHPDGG